MIHKKYFRYVYTTLFFTAFFQCMILAQEPIRLLVRADDMGNSHDMNLGIIKAHKEGIVTSASVMPTSPYFEEAVRLCKENPTLAAGIHLTVMGTKQRPVLSPDEVPSIVTPQGFFYEDSKSLLNANPKPEEVEREFRAQIEKVRATGLHYVYLDWHRGVPQLVRDIVLELCQEKQLIYGQDGNLYGYSRTRIQPAAVSIKYIRPDGSNAYYSTPAYSEEVKQSYFDALSSIKPGQWWGNTHPGLYAAKGDLTELLCDPRALEIIKQKNIQLVSYADLWEEEFGQAE